MSLTDARKKAKIKLGEVASGVDVQAEKMTKQRAGTFGELAERYLDEYAKRELKSWKQSEHKVEKYMLPHWRHMQLTAITPSEVRRLFNRMTNSGSPIAGNQAAANGCPVAPT